jgi:starch synthase
MSDLTVLSVASEIFPLVKTGGLADVTGALPQALAAEGIRVTTLVPGYPAVVGALERPGAVIDVGDLGGPARIVLGRVGGLDLAVLDAPHHFDRAGGPYVDADGNDWPDNAERFAALAHAAVRIVHGAVEGFHPDLVHAHDWQAGLVPALLAYSGRPVPTVMTVHNLAFQGKFPAAAFPALGLPPSAFAMDGVEYYGGVGYLKAGLHFAHHVTTVSPSYAYEIMGPAAGMGLDGLLRSRAETVTGILNGIDTDVWDPDADAHLVATFGRRHLGRRQKNKTALLARLGLDSDPDALLFGAVSRLTWQKGMDLLADAIPEAVAGGAMVAIVGTGDATIEAGLRAAETRFPGRVGVRIGYDEGLAHLVQGGVDAFLIPSRFEPCGLTQLCALRYGAVPVCARVGGLADTIVDANEMALAAEAATGILFSPPSAEGLSVALRRTMRLWADRSAWKGLQKRGMATDVGWSAPARRYAGLFRGLVDARAP